MSQVSHNSATGNKPNLLDQVRDAIRTKPYSIKTEEVYVHWIQGVRYFMNLMILILKHIFEITKITLNKKNLISPSKRFILFHNKRHPKEMSEKEINEFLTHLAVREKVSASTQNSPREIL